MACFFISCYIEEQYERAYNAHLDRSVIERSVMGLANPATHKIRDGAVLFAQIVIFTLAVVLAVRNKSWLDWFVVLFAAGAGFGILLNLSAGL